MMHAECHILRRNLWGRSDRDSMDVGFTTTCAISPITTKVVSSNLAHDEVYSIQHYVIKFVSELGQVFSGFLSINLTARYN